MRRTSGGGEMFGRNLGRLSAYRNDGGVRTIFKRPLRGAARWYRFTTHCKWRAHHDDQTILFYFFIFYTSALATLLFSSDSTEAYFSFKIDNIGQETGKGIYTHTRHYTYL